MIKKLNNSKLLVKAAKLFRTIVSLEQEIKSSSSGTKAQLLLYKKNRLESEMNFLIQEVNARGKGRILTILLENPDIIEIVDDEVLLERFILREKNNENIEKLIKILNQEANEPKINIDKYKKYIVDEIARINSAINKIKSVPDKNNNCQMNIASYSRMKEIYKYKLEYINYLRQNIIETEREILDLSVNLKNTSPLLIPIFEDNLINIAFELYKSSKANSACTAKKNRL